MSLSPDLVAAIGHAVEEDGGARPAMLEALRLVQQAHGWVSDEHLADLADVVGVTTAELEDIATFYSLIFRRPVGERLVLLCDGASCWMNGAERVRAAFRERFGIGPGETTADGFLTLIDICCVGGCDRAPAAVVGRERTLVGPIDPDDLEKVVEAAR